MRVGLRCVILLSLWLVPAAARGAPAYYTLSDFQLYTRQADGTLRRTEVLSQLSRQQVVGAVAWTTPAERDAKLQRLQAFLQHPPRGLPAWRQARPGPQGASFATYVFTLAGEQSLAQLAVVLNALQEQPALDYALPVLTLSQGAVVPSIDFTVVFAAHADEEAIRRVLARQPVSVVQQQGTTYTLRLRPQAVTNLFAVWRAFAEAAPLVADVQPAWLDLAAAPATPPPVAALPVTPVPLAPAQAPPAAALTVRTALETGWAFPLVEVRQPVQYRLEIERSPEVTVLAESVAATAIRRLLARSTDLPEELLEVTEAARTHHVLDEARVRETRVYTLRFSKPGTYTLPPLPVVYRRSGAAPRTVASEPARGHTLTVDAHLSPAVAGIPGELLELPANFWPLWRWLPWLAAVLGAGGGMLLVAGLWRRPPRQMRAPAPPSPRQLRQQALQALQHLRQTLPEHGEAVRPWLRRGAGLLRRFLGQWCCNDATAFTGAAGLSATTILDYLQATPEAQAQLEPALHLLETLDRLAAAPEVTLTAEACRQLCAELEAALARLMQAGRSHDFR